MWTKQTIKKTLITGLTAVMLVGGATSAFADGKGKGRDRHDDDRRPAYSRNVGQAYKDFRSGSPLIIQNGKNNRITINVNFSDMRGADVEWAMRSIARLAPKGVFEGYEDGTFRPRQSVSRIEAIAAAVRLLGLKEEAESEEAKSTKLNFKDADKIAKKYPWAVGYVAVALENDLFAEGDDKVHPEKPADRLWATTLLVKALKLDDEAKAKMNTQLPFKDANQIPAGSVGYVAVAVEKGLINGYENNTFRPNKPVTRAELAALLDRAGEQLPGWNENLVAGTLNAVNGNTLSITKDGATAIVTLDPNAFIFRDGQRVSVADLQPGDTVKAFLFNGTVYFVEAVKGAQSPQSFTVSGTFRSLTLDGQGKIASITINQAVYGQPAQPVTYTAASDVVVEGDSSKLTAGQPVELSGQNALVSKIVIK